MKKIILLGASGSIGTQTIDVITNHQDEYELVAFSVGRRIDEARKILNVFDVKNVCVGSHEDACTLSKEYPHVHFTHGDDGLLELVSLEEGNWVVNALVGSVGLRPTLVAIEHGKNIALANKETLVVGGKFVKEALKKHHVELTPIDSEHSAIFQCLQGINSEDIDKLIITASGGSFRDKTREELKDVTKEMALAHPNWSMGHRITIDSSTMMNKGFEVIEAHYLFDIDFDHIKVLMNKESIIHSMVQYVDNSFIAQLGTADMRLPIQYALTYPSRITLYGEEELDLAKIGTLHFGDVSFERFPLLKLAFEAGKKGGNCGAVINGADEACIDLFLQDKISFLDIEKGIMAAYEAIDFIAEPTYEDLYESDRKARAFIYGCNWKGVA